MLKIDDIVTFSGFGNQPCDARVTKVYSETVLDLETGTKFPRKFERVVRAPLQAYGAFSWTPKEVAAPSPT